MKSKAILFGINYVNTPQARLRGCVNDVKNVAKYLTKEEKYDVVKVYSDEADETKTRGQSIVNSMYKLAIDSHRYRLERVWIHFSGHGTHVRDSYGYRDESDGNDECIVPSDYNRCGVIRDDTIKRILRMFNPTTKVTCVFDCCHSGTIGDLKYVYKKIDRTPEIENNGSKCMANICLISGCTDSQTSADAFNVQGKRQYTGAMTSCLLEVLKNESDKSIFNVLESLRDLLRQKRFPQYPLLSSSFEVPQNYVLK
uniref:Peptidase C14 caspase domain-containing protein n=1 Tax=Pyramimonas orientalis virus TaxID=455367 RepID=A0A7M3UPF5_POV01|nr:hypothetical protein HWQ62_00513 [Pyramimonas orientalis virus]